MPDLLDGQSLEIQGSAAKPYVLKNVGGVYSCSCPAWRNQSLPIDRRTCKHLRQYRGEAREQARLMAGAARAEACPFVRILDQVSCDGEHHLRTELDRIEALGGEGIMLRQPDSMYEAGRSLTLLKIKRFHDGEAVVVQHLPGAGRHRGRMGALLVQLANGTQFSVGTGFTDAKRQNPPPIGTQITFRYQELTDGGVPRFPSFIRVRDELAF